MGLQMLKGALLYIHIYIYIYLRFISRRKSLIYFIALYTVEQPD